jgi:hypothetical protein
MIRIAASERNPRRRPGLDYSSASGDANSIHTKRSQKKHKRIDTKAEAMLSPVNTLVEENQKCRSAGADIGQISPLYNPARNGTR